MQLHSSYDSTVAKARVQYQIIMLFQTINLAYWRLHEILRLDMLSDFERLLIIRLHKALLSKSNLTAELGMANKMLGDWSICILFCSLWDQGLPQVKYMHLILQLVRSRTASSEVCASYFVACEIKDCLKCGPKRNNKVLCEKCKDGYYPFEMRTYWKCRGKYIGACAMRDIRPKRIFMMTSSNGNIFRVTGHLCG